MNYFRHRRSPRGGGAVGTRLGDNHYIGNMMRTRVDTCRPLVANPFSFFFVSETTGPSKAPSTGPLQSNSCEPQSSDSTFVVSPPQLLHLSPTNSTSVLGIGSTLCLFSGAFPASLQDLVIPCSNHWRLSDEWHSSLIVVDFTAVHAATTRKALSVLPVAELKQPRTPRSAPTLRAGASLSAKTGEYPTSREGRGGLHPSAAPPRRYP